MIRLSTVLFLLALAARAEDKVQSEFIFDEAPFAGGAYILFHACARKNAQHLCQRVLSIPCPGILTVAEIKCDVGATRCADHVRHLGGESPLPNLMEV